MMLEVNNLVTGYLSDPIIHGASFSVEHSSILAVLGHNGAGKSSVVRALVGLMSAWEGTIRLNGKDVTSFDTAARVRSGIAVSFQDHCVFPRLSVRQNLSIASFASRPGRECQASREERVFALFPKLEERYDQVAFTLSGGERRMLSIGMALMSDPKLLVLDEPSTGLSPAVLQTVMEKIVSIRDELQKSIVLVEQNVNHAISVADRVVVLKTGQVVFEGSSTELNTESTELVKLF